MKYVLFLTISVLLTACSTVPSSDHDSETPLPQLPIADIPGMPGHHNYPGDVLAQEVDILQQTLEELYPGLYDHHSKARMQQRFDHMRSVANGSPELSYSQWLPEVVQLTADLADHELTWGHSGNYRQWRQDSVLVPPFNLTRSNGKWYVDQVFASDSGLESGMEISAIQGQSPDEYVTANALLLPPHGNNPSIQAEWLERAYPMHHTNFWERLSTYEVTLASGETKTVPGITAASYQVAENDTNTPQRIDFNSEKTVGILRLPNLDYRQLEQLGMPYDQAFAAVFSSLQNRMNDRLVIDLRGAEGGHVKVAMELLKYLTTEPLLDSIYKSPSIQITHQAYAFSTKMMEPKFLLRMMRPVEEQPALAFNGPVVVITDGHNRGAAGLLVAALRNRPNTQIVGEQPPVYAWGIHHGQYFLEMPYSKLVVGIPSTRLITDKSKAGSTDLLQLDHAWNNGPDLLPKAVQLAVDAKP